MMRGLYRRAGSTCGEGSGRYAEHSQAVGEASLSELGGGGGHLGALSSRPWRWLGSHPIERSAVNWVLWAFVALVGISVAAGSSSEGGPSKPLVATATTDVGVTSTSTDRATTTRPTSGATRPAPPANPSTPSAVPATGSEVVNTVGAILPNSSRTPGAINPQVTQADIGSTICVAGWTSTIRPPSSYTTALKEQQLASGYAYHGDTKTSDYEEDHLISLEIGGSPTSPLNLWPEPYNTPDGARVKDQIENKLNALVCDRTITLATAQHAIATNWYAAYLTYIGTPPTSSATTSATTTVMVPVSHSASLSCSASMSNASPSDYSTTDVIVHTSAGAAVTTTAHYKSTDTTHTGTADGSGVATIPYDISRATVGYTVVVDVTVSAGRAAASCSTSFTPSR